MSKRLKFALLVLLIVAWGCAMPGRKNEIVVNVLDPVRMTEGMHCEQVTVIGVASEHVIAPTPEDKRIIAAEAAKLINETNYLTSTSLPDEDIHQIYVRVDRFDIRRWKGTEIDKNAGWSGKTATISALMSLRENGKDCYATNVSKEFVRQLRDYESDRLPSDFEVKSAAIRDAMRRVISDVSPKLRQTTRTVMGVGGSGTLIEQYACQEALDVLAKENQSSSSVAYNTGVAFECLAMKTNAITEKVKLLRRALESYRQAQTASPSDQEIGRARQQVEETVKLYGAAMERQIKAREKFDSQYKGKSSF